jgi:beta-lactamase regulating signal transducer with metallopeptidase domain
MGWSDVCHHIVELGLGVFIQSSCLITLGLFAGRLLRRRGPSFELAAYRATFVCVVVSALMASAAFGRVRPLYQISIGGAATAAIDSIARTHTVAMTHAPTTVSNSASQVFESPSTIGAWRPDRMYAGLPILYEIIVGLWLIGFAIQILWLVGCHAALRRFMQRGKYTTAEPLVRMLSEITSRAGTPPPFLMLHPAAQSPFLMGVQSPTIVVPTGALAQYGEEGMRAVLAHEVSHSLQRDCAWNLAFRLATALLWPQFLLHILYRRWQEAAEYACDQWVLAHACPPRFYADCLLNIAEDRAAPRSQRALAIGVAPFRSMVGKRLVRIAGWSGGKLVELSRAGRFAMTCAAAAAAGGVLFLVSANAGARSADNSQQRSALLPIPSTSGRQSHPREPHKTPKKRNERSMLAALTSGAVRVKLPAPAAPERIAAAEPITPRLDRNDEQTTSPSTAFAAVPTPVISEGGDSGKAITLDFTDAPVQDVLTQLLRAKGADYTIDSDVTGVVSVHLTQVNSDTALKTVMRASSSPLTYDLIDNVYHIRMKRSSSPEN